MRQIVLDTETTGLDPAQGHRIIEIGGVEVIDRRLTGKTFHQYLQPDREIDAGAVAVHGITNAFLADKPRFGDVVEDLMNFLQGAELVIHNAPFDVGFLNAELGALEGRGPLEEHCQILDTLVMARTRHPGQRNSLDALCNRYEIDNAHRQKHGALLDAEILADVYLAMTGGQVTLQLEDVEAGGTTTEQAVGGIRRVRSDRPALPVIRASTAELTAHDERLAAIDQASGGACLWLQPGAGSAKPGGLTPGHSR